MPDAPPLEPDEVLLHRLPPRKKGRRTEFGQPVKARELRPRPDKERPGERQHGLSCSRLRLTSPGDLLRAVADFPDGDSWTVCAFRLRDVRGVPDPDGGSLRVEVQPTDDDPGHVVIVGSDGRPCPDKQQARDDLAAVARVLSDDELRTLRVGDPPPDDLR